MKRSGPPERRTPLKASDVRMKQGPQLKPQSSRVQADQGRRRAEKKAVVERDQVCQLALLLPSHRCFGEPELHHRLKATRGGKYDRQNGVLLCSLANQWVECEPIKAAALGLSLPSGRPEKSILLIDRKEAV